MFLRPLNLTFLDFRNALNSFKLRDLLAYRFPKGGLRGHGVTLGKNQEQFLLLHS